MDKRYLLNHISKAYGINGQSLFKLEGGVVNETLLVKSSDGDIVFRIYSKKDHHLVLYEVEVLTFLMEKKFSSPILVKSDKGEYLHSYKGKPTLAYEYINGVSPQYISNTELKQIGFLIGKMHVMLNGFIPKTKKGTWEPLELDSMLRREYSRLVYNSFHGIADLMLFCRHKFQEHIIPPDLPKGVTHQDIKHDNILRKPDGSFAFIDFDNAYTGTLLTDLTTTAIWTCFKDSVLLPDKLNALVSGYDNARSLNMKERSCFYDAFAHRLIREVFIGPAVTEGSLKPIKERSLLFKSRYEYLIKNKEVVEYVLGL